MKSERWWGASEGAGRGGPASVCVLGKTSTSSCGLFIALGFENIKILGEAILLVKREEID